MLSNLSKNKKIIGVIACIVVALAVAIPVGMNKLGTTVDGKSASKSSQNANSNNNKSSENKDESNDKNVETSNENKDKSDEKDVETSNENKDGESDTSTSNGGSSGSGGSTSSNNNISNGNNSDNDSTSGNSGDKVTSNFKTPDSSLTIQRIKGYSGIFIEDGSDKEVENVAAIQVKNTSKQIIEYAQIELYNGDKKLVFEVSTLPANSSAVVMEKNKTAYSSSKGMTYGKSTVAYTDKLEKSSDIKYTTVDNNGIKVTNKSKKDIGCVRIFYKYKSEEGYYIGGITYTAKVEDLKAGKSQTVYPSHFATEGGEIMMVKTYDE